jgi:DNA-directed RNA polymerase specialized sigma24 family protein
MTGTDDESPENKAASGADRTSRLDELVQRATAGDESVWTELLNETVRRRLFARYRGEARQPDLLEDAWSQACLQAVQSIHTLKNPMVFDAWLAVIFRREIRNLSMKDTRQHNAEVQAAPVTAGRSAEAVALDKIYYRHVAQRLVRGLQELAGLDYGDGRGRAHLGTLRHRLLVVPARLVHHAGQVILRLPPGHQLLAQVLAQLRRLPVWT